MLTVPQRSKVQSLLKDAKTNISLKGRSFPDGEETWHLFANWLPIAKSLRLTPHVTTTVEDMGKLLAGIYEAGSDPRGHLRVTSGVYLCAGSPPLADIILSHTPELT